MTISQRMWRLISFGLFGVAYVLVLVAGVLRLPLYISFPAVGYLGLAILFLLHMNIPRLEQDPPVDSQTNMIGADVHLLPPIEESSSA